MEVRPSSEQPWKTARGGGDEAKILIDGRTDFLALPPFADSFYSFPLGHPLILSARTGGHKQAQAGLATPSLAPTQLQVRENSEAITHGSQKETMVK